MRDNTEKQLDCKGNRGAATPAPAKCASRPWPSSPSLSIDAGANGGIQVKGWSKLGVCSCQVEAWAADDGARQIIAGQVKVITQSGRITPKVRRA